MVMYDSNNVNRSFDEILLSLQANLENIRIFKDHLDNVTTHGLANFTLALTKAFEILDKVLILSRF